MSAAPFLSQTALQLGPLGLSYGVVIVGVILIAGVLYYVVKRITGAVGEAAQAVNPFNNQNVINTSVNKVLAPALGTNKLTGEANTIGSAFYFGAEKIRALF